jgi:hypothetical protein
MIQLAMEWDNPVALYSNQSGVISAMRYARNAKLDSKVYWENLGPLKGAAARAINGYEKHQSIFFNHQQTNGNASALYKLAKALAEESFKSKLDWKGVAGENV